MAKEIYNDDIRSFLIDDGYLIIKKKGENDLKLWLKDMRIDDNIPPNLITTLNKMGIKPTDRIAVYSLQTGKNPLIITKIVKNQLQKEIDLYKAEYQAKETKLETERRDPANIERNAIFRLYADANRAENSSNDNNVETSMRLRSEASRRLKAWREKYPERARKEDADKLIAKAEREEELASGALFYDADGSLTPEMQQNRHDQFMANAKEYRKQANDLLKPDTGSPAKTPEPEPKPPPKPVNTEPQKPEVKALPEVNESRLKQINNERKPLSQSADVSRSNKTTVLPSDPRIKNWVRDPGSMDVLGVDTPPSITKPTRMPREKGVRLSPKTPRLK